jgi:hypothetical protein
LECNGNHTARWIPCAKSCGQSAEFQLPLGNRYQSREFGSVVVGNQ